MNLKQPLAASILRSWREGTVLSASARDHYPASVENGYAVQADLASLREEHVVGWKIAATSEAGRRHIDVDRPLAGRLYESIVYQDGAIVSLAGNRMRVAEAEIVLGLREELAPLDRPRSESEVAVAVGTLHAGLEIPDSRFEEFTAAGTACLIADNACAGQFVLGEALQVPDDLGSLDFMPTTLHVNDRLVTSGVGSDALGGSLSALTWLVNQVNALGITLHAGEFVTTGVTGVPSGIRAGDTLTVTIGSIGRVQATITA